MDKGKGRTVCVGEGLETVVGGKETKEGKEKSTLG